MNGRSVSALLLSLAALSVPRQQPAFAVAQASLRDLDANVSQPIASPLETTTRISPGRDEVLDPEALEHTKTFCVDTSHMEDSQAVEVKEFLAKERGRKKVLGQLPWQLVDDCTKVDAVARIYFISVHEEITKVGSAARSTGFRRGTQPVLLLYDKASIRLFFRAEGTVLHGDAADALGSPFAMLAKDLRKINR
jgi:hypothetical protein